ncbi:MAG: hypothetical protein ACRDJW_20965 [Thermomicrobiales bacterium]
MSERVVIERKMLDGSFDTWAPIALFIYKRADHTRQTIMSLAACPGFADSPLYVYADGPRRERDWPAVEATRAMARDLLGDRATFVERETNLGLAASIVAGVTELCDRYGKVIVVEDDLVVAPTFLHFLNEGLRRFEDQPRVMQVCGHMYDVPALRESSEALLLPITDSWGWGTWKRAWDLYDPDARGWQDLLRDRRERKRFDLDGRCTFSKLLALQMRRGLDSWAIRWYYSVFIHRGLALFPPRTLVVNTGLDGSGSHHRLALATQQAPIDSRGAYGLPAGVRQSAAKEGVYDAIGGFMPWTTRQRILALPGAILRRLRPSRIAWAPPRNSS